jgi:hypothetical protein
MANDHDQFHESGPREFSDDAIRRFLLGAMGASQQPLFEQRLMIDDDLDARVSRLEYELADDYAFNRLNPADRKLFERHYLASADRKHTLLVSSVLHDRFAGARIKQRFTMGERLKSRFTLHQPVLRVVFGLLIMCLLLGTVWLVTKDSRIAKRFIPTRTPSSPGPAAPRQAGHSSNPTQTPVHREDSSPPQTHEPGAPVVTSFVLSPNRREAATIPVVNLRESKPDVVRLQLVLKTIVVGTYRAELRTDDGQSVFSAESLAMDGSTAPIDFEVPARLLKTGNYQIELTLVSSGSKETVASYYFLVQIAD